MTLESVQNVIGLAMAALTSIATLLSIGVGFLTKPGKPTLYWSFSFVLAMSATFAYVAGDLLDIEVVRRIGLGALMGAPALLWSGFRSLWGLRPFAWLGAAVSMLSATSLVLSGDSGWFAIAYRVSFLAASVFGALFFLGWVRDRSHRRDPVLLPLGLVSIAFLALAVTVAVAGALPSMADDLRGVRLVTSIGMLAYTTCALVAVIGISTRDVDQARRTAAVGDWERFQTIGRQRLAVAERATEPWSLIYLRMDDLVEIRRLVGTDAVAALTSQFAREVRAVFPDEASVDSPARGTTVALIPRSEPIVREALRTVLERISALEVGQLPINPSASAGWAPSSVVGYDFDALLYMGREAATVAAERGGDRWERVGTTVTDRILSHSVRL